LPLLPPTVIGPISVCNSSVRVRGQNIGANVQLFQSGNESPIGGGVATWSDQPFPLKAGVKLTAGQSITATQTKDGVTSPASPSPIQIQAGSPARIGAVMCATHIYECGQALSFIGAVPGATIEVTVAGQVRGSRVSADGTAKVPLSAPTKATDTLVVTQTACGQTGPPATLPQPDKPPLTAQGLLPVPSIAGPVYACQEAIQIGNVVDGALVAVTQAPSATTASGLFATSSELLQTKPIGAGEAVSVMQSMPDCQIQGVSSAQVPVSPTAPVPVPSVIAPLCTGDVYVGLSNLIPGAQVEIFQGGVSLGTGACSTSTQYFAVPALSRKQPVQATQSLCGNTSELSKAVKVKGAMTLDAPAVEKTVFQCASTVQVSNLHPGAVVYVYSTELGAPIGIAQATGEEMDIRVAPLLTAGDQIYAQQQGCGQMSPQAQAVMVKPLPNQGAPAIIAPVGAGSSSVFVQNLIAGARVDVLVNGVFRGTAAATAPIIEVLLSPPILSIGDQVVVRESTCQGVVSGLPVTVTGCQCAQISKAPISGGLFLYTFNCATPANTVETVQVTAATDAEALQKAELGCDRQYGV